MASSFSEAYVRIAEPHEYTKAAWILTRSFARDPRMNWFGGVQKLIPSYKELPNYESHPVSAKRTLKNLFVFQKALVKATILSGGFITLAVIPPQGEEDEILAATTLWLKPGQSLDFSLLMIAKSRMWKVFSGWGREGFKRVLQNFSPAFKQSWEKGSKTGHSLDRLDSWHLLEMATDPPFEGRGLCSLMMKDGFERTSSESKPIRLKATTPRTRDIYTHFGFKIDEEHCFGKGLVDVNGLVAKEAATATGYREWIMTKV
ncbi:hypothetical protein Clacol_010331 [Clathrus columnatus]|uniref:N-acetyltransferase domain-containing protein n=1 Tax=Clathrus columnatus TaxID=1419009 RepID=A0AAV5AMZ4_9AGAM|nr:hypothetical protein Clacol_010331 [Clathrus columnatus]